MSLGQGVINAFHKRWSLNPVETVVNIKIVNKGQEKFGGLFPCSGPMSGPDGPAGE